MSELEKLGIKLETKLKYKVGDLIFIHNHPNIKGRYTIQNIQGVNRVGGGSICYYSVGTPYAIYDHQCSLAGKLSELLYGN